jgi:hypothetical protein
VNVLFGSVERSKVEARPVLSRPQKERQEVLVGKRVAGKSFMLPDLAAAVEATWRRATGNQRRMCAFAAPVG